MEKQSWMISFVAFLQDYRLEIYGDKYGALQFKILKYQPQL